MPAGWRHVENVLCGYVDYKTGVIPSELQPSLTQLARDTGLHRRSVMRYLNGLEKLGWVTRRRPSVHAARTTHARTQYSIRVGKHMAELGTAEPFPSDMEAPDLVTASPVSSDTAPHDSPRSSKSRAEEIREVIGAIRARSGVTVPDDWAERVLDQIVVARDRVRDPLAVIRAVIAKAPPNAYTPTPQPPRYTKEHGFQ